MQGGKPVVEVGESEMRRKRERWIRALKATRRTRRWHGGSKEGGGSRQRRSRGILGSSRLKTFGYAVSRDDRVLVEVPGLGREGEAKSIEGGGWRAERTRDVKVPKLKGTRSAAANSREHRVRRKIGKEGEESVFGRSILARVAPGSTWKSRSKPLTSCVRVRFRPCSIPRYHR